MKKEIKILGAGIAGLSASISLAKAGYKVLIFEKNGQIGQRFHNDYQGIENWIFKDDSLKYLQMININTDFCHYPFRALKVIGPKERRYDWHCEKELFYLVKRGPGRDTLDSHLMEQAKQLGVEIIFNSPRDHRSFGDIISQGYFPDKITDAIAIGYNFATNLPNQCWVIVNDNVAPGGYGYCLIADGQATIAICIFKKYEKSQSCLERAYDIFKKHVGFQVESEKSYFGGASNFIFSHKTTHNGQLYVGEAAGFIDFLWGFGIRYAMVSGYLAAQSIIEKKNYDELLASVVYPPLKASLVNRWLYGTFNNITYPIMLTLIKRAKNPRFFLNRLTNYSFGHKLLLPLAKLALREKIKDRRIF